MTDRPKGFIRRTEIAPDFYIFHVAGPCPQADAIKRQSREAMERARRKAREEMQDG